MNDNKLNDLLWNKLNDEYPWLPITLAILLMLFMLTIIGSLVAIFFVDWWWKTLICSIGLLYVTRNYLAPVMFCYYVNRLKK